jgi:hypothetical protein
MGQSRITNCIDCGTEIITSRKIPAEGLSCGTGSCLVAHNERVHALRTAPRAPRRRTSNPQPLYGDFAWLATVNGCSTDGTGRKARA